ncbi:MAG: flippase-like domain-containing protein [Bacteroidales bacterium]|nr:flippase-like domain-containing protein [Bacteroidales bacterium]
MTAQAQTGKRWKDLLKMVLFLGIGVFFIYWFLLKLDADQKQAIWTSFLDANYGWVAVCALCSIVSHLLRAMRWQLLYHPLNLRPKLNNTFGSVMVAYLGNLAFPRAGEVMRCATMHTSNGIPVEKSLGTVVTERLIDLAAFAVILVIGFMAMFGQAKDWLYNTLSERFDHLPNMVVVAVVGAGAIVLLWLAYKLLWKRLLRFKPVAAIDRLVRSTIDGVKSIFHLQRRDILLFIVYSIGIYFLYILGGLIIFQAFDQTASLDFGAAFVVYLFGSVGMTFSQGGIGVYPVVVQLALAIYGISVETGTACGWLLWGSQQAVVLLVGGAYMIYFSISKKKRKE